MSNHKQSQHDNSLIEISSDFQFNNPNFSYSETQPGPSEYKSSISNRNPGNSSKCPTRSASFDSTQVETGVEPADPIPLIDPLICDPNKIVEEYGNKGIYQWWTMILCMWVMIFYSGSMHVLPFVNEYADVECKVDGMNSTINSCLYNSSSGKEETCGANDKSSILNYSQPKPITSMLVDFEMPCANPFWREAGQSAFTLGALTIVPIISYMADRYGRKNLFILCCLGSALANIAAAFTSNIYTFIVARYVVGSLSDSYYTIGAIYACELSTVWQRNYVGLISTISWAAGICYVGMLTKLIFDWRNLYIAMAAPGLITIFYFCALPESPHWAIRHKKGKAIRGFIKNSNHMNGFVIDLSLCIDPAKMYNNETPTEKQKSGGAESICALFRSVKMLKIMLICGLLTFTMNFFYFAISLEAVDLSDDHFTAYMLSGVVDIPGGIVCIPLMHFFGRKTLAISTCVACGLTLIAAPYLDGFGGYGFKVGFILFAKMINIIAQSVIPMWATEMLPTSVRIAAFSIINVPQSLGQILAPFFRHVHSDYKPTKYVALGIASILAGLTGFFLKETKGKDLPEQIAHS